MVEKPNDNFHVWNDDLVSFAIGCSFSFEQALIESGIEFRHISLGLNVPMYRTNRTSVSAGVFNGPLVVSMRPLKPSDAIRAIQITSRFPSVHGAPVHTGDPESIGIADLGRTDYGDTVQIHGDELLVFWACGVNPQAVIAQAKLNQAKPSQAKPSQAKPSQAKPSQAKPSQAKLLCDPRARQHANY